MNSPGTSLDRVLLLVLMLVPLGLSAAEREAPKPDNAATWLELQRSGQQASPQTQTQTPSERELSYQRWLDSYKHAIPESLGDSSGAQASSGS